MHTRTHACTHPPAHELGTHPSAAQPSPTPCRTGHYCPSGTADPTEHPCPAGTFNNQTRATSDSFCLKCAAGAASSEGASFCSVCETGTYEHKAICLPCKLGHFCQVGKAKRCPVNTYADLTHAYMHDCMEGAIGTGTNPVQKIRLTVQSASKVCYLRKVPHKLRTVPPTLPLSLFIHTRTHCMQTTLCTLYSQVLQRYEFLMAPQEGLQLESSQSITAKLAQ